MEDEYALLIHSMRSGDKTLFNKTLSRLTVRIQKILFVQVIDWTIVPDLTQEILLKVLNSVHCFRGESQFSTWLYRVIQNTLKNYYRSIIKEDICPMDDITENEYEDGVNPIQNVMFLEMHTRIETVLKSMPYELRECIGRYIYDGDSYETIAKKMKCPLGTVRSRIHRAKQMITYAIENQI